MEHEGRPGDVLKFFIGCNPTTIVRLTRGSTIRYVDKKDLVRFVCRIMCVAIFIYLEIGAVERDRDMKKNQSKTNILCHFAGLRVLSYIRYI